jgi:hypothetical protein
MMADFYSRLPKCTQQPVICELYGKDIEPIKHIKERIAGKFETL